MTDKEWERGDPVIVCACNKVEDKEGNEHLLVGARHWDKHMHKQADALGRGDPDSNFKLGTFMSGQGFIDQFGKWYSREDAWILAEKNGQIRFIIGGEEGTLFSENLY